ncbi:MAG: hypothetical protein HQL16_01420 [Candidatus Omnitrophica bacterium]|nr:hypothetical protein [Candidatus Omnitrophota bacterium]
MEKLALKVGGVIFVLIGILHALRVIMMVHVTIGHTYIPLKASVIAAVISLALGVWMLKVACCGCLKK